MSTTTELLQLEVTTEQEEFELLAEKTARLVLSRARSVKLRKRGEIVWWSNYFNGWLWMPAQ